MELVLTSFTLIIFVSMAVTPIFLLIELFREEQNGSLPWVIGWVILTYTVGILALFKIQEYM